MILMYDTGARNQELLDVRLRDLHLEGKSPYVVITGKGRKTRLVPIMQKTVGHSEWLGHAQISTTLHYYANADIGMKKEAIEKATSKLNPMVSDDSASLEWENDDEMLRRLYDLSN